MATGAHLRNYSSPLFIQLGARFSRNALNPSCPSGDTRTAAISGAYVALALAMQRLTANKTLGKNPLYGQVAAVSVGIYRGTPVLDLDYAEDSEAETDMNVVMNDAGNFIEVQGTAEGHAFTDDELAAMLKLAHAGIDQIINAQNEALAG